MNDKGKRIDRSVALNISRSCVGFNIRKAARRIGNIYDRAFGKVGIRNTQFSVMMGAAIQDKIPISQMASILVMDRSTLSRNARLLAGKGYLRLENGIDRREQLISLTDEGWLLLEQAIPIWQQTQSELESSFGSEWLNELLDRLHEMNHRLK